MSLNKDAQSNRRSRVVINLDNPQPSSRGTRGPRQQTPARKSSRLFKILGIIAAALALCFVFALAGIFFWWQHYKTSPSYTLALIVDAAERNDTATSGTLVDEDKITESLMQQVKEKAATRYASSLSLQARKQLDALLPRLTSNLKNNVHDEVNKQIKEIAARAAGKPFVLIALAMPYTLNVKQDNDSATASVETGGETVELTLQRNGERWKVVAVKDDVLAARIVDNMAKDLPSVGKQLDRLLK